LTLARVGEVSAEAADTVLQVAEARAVRDPCCRTSRCPSTGLRCLTSGCPRSSWCFDWQPGRWVLGPDQHQELVLQRGDVSSDLCRVELLVLLTKAGLDLFRDAFVGQNTLVGGLGGVVALGDTFAPRRCFSTSFCWGEKKFVCSLSSA